MMLFRTALAVAGLVGGTVRLVAAAAPTSTTPTWAYVLVGIGVAALTAFGTYYAIKRVNSGKIDTSEAAQLWAESNAMRKELRDETVSLRTQNQENTKKIEELEEKFRAAEAETAECKHNSAILQTQINELQSKLSGVHSHTQKKTAAKKTTTKPRRSSGR